jgi:hypothetical protein
MPVAPMPVAEGAAEPEEATDAELWNTPRSTAGQAHPAGGVGGAHYVNVPCDTLPELEPIRALVGAPAQMPSERHDNGNADGILSDEAVGEWLAEQIPQTGWRWEVKGAGRYKGRYYNWRLGSGKSRKYRNGGNLAESRKWLEAEFPRPGKGNRKPRKRRLDSDSPADLPQRD